MKLAPFSDLVPEDVKEMVEEKKQAITAGEFEVFPGMTNDELREIRYFEPNVVGELTISVNVGKEFIIALDENPATGYLWQEDYDDSLLELVEDRYVSSVAPESGGTPILGAGGTADLEIQGVAARRH